MTLLLIFALLQLADYYTTRRILALGGRELNPVVQYLIDKLGTQPALILAKLLACAIGYGLWAMSPNGLGVLIVVYVLVVWNNFRVLEKMK